MKTLMFKWLPVIDGARGTGCGECIEACGPQCLELVDHIAVLTEPDRCGSEEHCLEPCPEAAIRMDWVAVTGNANPGKWWSLVAY